MILIVLGTLLLAWPLSAIPQMLQNKRKIGTYFGSDKRIIVPKYTNFGNSLNTQNKYAYLMNIGLGLLLIIRGIMELWR